MGITEYDPFAAGHHEVAVRTFVRGLTLAHMDATRRSSEAANQLLSGDVEALLAARGVEAFVHRT